MLYITRTNVKFISVLVSSLFCYSIQAEPIDSTEVNTDKQEQKKNSKKTVQQSTKQIDNIIVTGRFTQDNKGYSDVYHKNVSNVYVGKEYLDKYTPTNSADVFKGLNGVYSMDARNGNSITPNIRGLSGEGRIPLTVDGVENSLNVWLMHYGVGNRSYVDPALFRSITVEKSPTLTRGVKSGVGGSVTIRTIDPIDIVPEGKTWGIEVKAETAGNSVKPQYDLNSHLGKDYRDIPNAVSTNNNDIRFLEVIQAREHGNKHTLNFKDNALAVSAAFKTDLTDGMVSYSYRNRGNYFAGKNGASRYENNRSWVIENQNNYNAKLTYEMLYPNIAKIYLPGAELLNSSNESKTLLLKNNWYLPNNQTLNLSMMKTDLKFGEIPAFFADSFQGYGELGILGKSTQQVALRTHIKQKNYKLGYQWKPEGNRWIDLASNFYHIQNKSIRNASGGMNFRMAERDKNYDAWMWCNVLGIAPDDNWDKQACQKPPITDFVNNATPPKLANTDGRFNLDYGAYQGTNHKRWGMDVSNVFTLTDRLKVTLAGDVQYEKLNEKVDLQTYETWLEFQNGTRGTHDYGPRSGRRHEYGASVNMEWQPIDRLRLSAGVRYNKYWAYDDRVAEIRSQKLGKVQNQVVGKKFEYLTIMDDETAWKLDRSQFLFDTIDDWSDDNPEYREAMKLNDEYNAMKNKLGYISANEENGINYWVSALVIPVEKGKLLSDQNPFANGQIDMAKTVNNPQGKTGEYPKHLPPSNMGGDEKRYISAGLGKEIFAEPDDIFAPPKRQYGHAWSPIFSASFDLTDNITLFGRYAQTTRFPSIFEAISMVTSQAGENFLHDGATKPERSKSWELGYAHDLSSYLRGQNLADIRLTYFSNTIHDLMDRGDDFRMIQYDKKIMNGIEFQSRFDSGRFFASLGGTYRLKQKTCDRDVTRGMDVYYGRIPECIDGAFGQNILSSSTQPKYSVNLDLGTRLMNQKLELGTRLVYHSEAKNKELAQLDPKTFDAVATGLQGQPKYWRSNLLVDAYANYQINKNISMNIGVTNLTNQYYLDPMAKVAMPGPGRTLKLGITGKF